MKLPILGTSRERKSAAHPNEVASRFRDLISPTKLTDRMLFVCYRILSFDSGIHVYGHVGDARTMTSFGRR